MITLERTAKRLPGTYWRPVQRSVSKKRLVLEERQRTADVKHDARPKTVTYEGADRLLLGGDRQYTEARIEDPYKRGRFVGGFIYVRALAVFLHEDVVDRYEEMGERIGAGAIIGRNVKIDDNAVIGPFAELEAGVVLNKGVEVGGGTVVRKRAILGRGAKVGGNGYIAPFVRIFPDVTIGPTPLLQRQVSIGHGADIGAHFQSGAHSRLRPNIMVDDDVSIGEGVYLGSALVGEMTSIGDFSHLGDGSIIGAESEFGDFVRVAPQLILKSPTIAEDGAVITASNLMPRGE